MGSSGERHYAERLRLMPARAGISWGQVYFPKAVCELTFAFETNSAPGQFVPVHIHPTQDEFILVQEGVLDLKLDGQWHKATAGDLVRFFRAASHTAISTSPTSQRALCSGYRRLACWRRCSTIFITSPIQMRSWPSRAAMR